MALNVDQYLEVIGQFGPFQIRILIMFSFIFFPFTYQTLIMYFLAMDIPWHCSSQNSTLVTSCNSTSAYSSDMKNYDLRCSLKESEWEYAPFEYDGPRETIVNEWNLICDDKFLAWLATSMHFIGWAFGALVIGIISDKYGRRSVLFPSIFTVMLIGFLSSFTTEYWQFTLCRFIVGFAQGGAGLSMFVLATELVGPQKRALSGTLVWFYFTATLCALGLQAYFIRDWRTLSMVCTAPWIFCLIFWKWVPESIRWLMVNGKLDKAEELLANVARVNKTAMPKGEHLKPPIIVKSDGFLSLFRTRRMATFTLIQCYLWFINGMVYYGVSYGANDLGGSLYWNYILTSIVEVPGNIMVIHNSNKWGRRNTTIAHLVIGAIACIVVSAIPAGTGKLGYTIGRVFGAMVGKMCITCSFNTLYVYSAELFPTVVRNGGMGLVSVISRFGAATAPFVVEIDRVHPMLPFLLMGGMTFIGAGLCWFLPETLGKPTQEVFDQETSSDDCFSGEDVSLELKKTTSQDQLVVNPQTLSCVSAV